MLTDNKKINKCMLVIVNDLVENKKLPVWTVFTSMPIVGILLLKLKLKTKAAIKKKPA